MSNSSTGFNGNSPVAGQRPLLLSSWFLPFITIASAASLLAQHGFILGTGYDRMFNALDLVLALCFGLELTLNLAFARRKREAFYTRRFEIVPLVMILGVMAATWMRPTLAQQLGEQVFGADSLEAIYFGLVKIYLVIAIFVQLLKVLHLMLLQGVRPELMLAGSLLSLILLGTALLLLPRAMASTAPLSFVDAFFTATSTACVTGLLVRDLSEFSNLGQMIILALLQIGGLGIITFVAFLSVSSARTLPVSQMVAFRQLISTSSMSDLKGRVLGIFLFAFIVEAFGAVCLFMLLTGETDLAERIKWSVFHSISAFCHAGISLHPNSLVHFATSPEIKIVIMTLVVLGGIGFLVIPEVCTVVLQRTTRVIRRLLPLTLPPVAHPARLSIQSRLGLRVSLWLTVGGALAFLLLEWNHLLANASWDHTALVSLFHSVVIRTAGFNTVPIDELRDATVLLMMILMSIGASPVSAGGGIKTVTFGVLLLALRSMLLSQDRVEVSGRTIPNKALIAALSVFVLYIMTAAIATLLLATFEPAFNIRAHLLETISALSTAGLSTGVTPQLSTPSKILLCVVMFVGRIGPISLVVSVFRARSRVDYEFPTEDVVVG